MSLLTRCAYCFRSRIQDEMLYCIHCHLSFCRGDCHSAFVAGKWHKVAAAND